MRPPSRRISSEAVKFWSWGPEVGGRKSSPTCDMELSHPRRRVSEERVPVCAAGPDQARPRSGKQTPHPRSAPPALPLSLELPRDPPPARCRRSPSGARRVRQAAMRSPAERARDPEPRPARGTPAGWSAGDPTPPPLHGFRSGVPELPPVWRWMVQAKNGLWSSGTQGPLPSSVPAQPGSFHPHVVISESKMAAGAQLPSPHSRQQEGGVKRGAWSRILQ
nr:N-acetyl-beta-glucosaminyl-glycoprotein 4-beta-N-acetylgalactosaminyltransferase 1-like [Kogia breviceps]